MVNLGEISQSSLGPPPMGQMLTPSFLPLCGYRLLASSEGVAWEGLNAMKAKGSFMCGKVALLGAYVGLPSLSKVLQAGLNLSTEKSWQCSQSIM